MYNKYSDDELIEAYSTMIDYSGKADMNILEEINQRGGLDKFLQLIRDKEINKKESDRVLNEIIRLNKEGIDLEKIKGNVSSEVWTKQHLNAFIENRYIKHQLYLTDKFIDKDLIAKSFLGTLLGSFAGTAAWIFSIVILKFVFFPILVLVYLISYFIIKGFTGKTHNNAVVFIGSLISTIISFAIGFIILNKGF